MSAEPVFASGANETGARPLSHAVADSLEDYFRTLNGHPPKDLYEMVLNQVEQPLLRTVLQHCRGNQTRAAEMLGLNRATLRKKLRHHGLATGSE